MTLAHGSWQVPLARSAVVAWTTGVLAAALGANMESLVAVALAGVLLGLGFVLHDASRARSGGITPATFFAAGFMITSIANVVGLSQQDGPRAAEFFVYYAPEFLELAGWLHLIGGVVIIGAIRAASRTALGRGMSSVLPRVRGRVSDRWLVPGGITVALVGLGARFAGPLASLGTLSALLHLAPNLVAFVLAYEAARRRVRGALVGAFLVAGVEAARAALQAYLRSEIITPILAVAFGTLLGARSLRPLFSRYFLPLYAAGAVFVIAFGALGELRGTGERGVERLRAVYEYQRQQGEGLDEPRTGQTLLSRLTSFNQLSQAGRVVHEDGFLDGATLEYLGYAFIPRFIWPEKPIIAKGAWFALRIGQARVLPSGRISNSVNMTIAGELYMNFGWPGVVLGCVVFGVLVGMLWETTSFWKDPRNVLGKAFGFYLLWASFGLGADLQLVVTAIAVYLVFVALGFGMRLLASGHTATPRVSHAQAVRAP